MQTANILVVAYSGTGIAHNCDEAIQQHHGHGEDEEQQQDDPNDGVVAVVEQVQVCSPQHNGEEGYKGMQDIAELLHQYQDKHMMLLMWLQYSISCHLNLPVAGDSFTCANE